MHKFHTLRYKQKGLEMHGNEMLKACDEFKTAVNNYLGIETMSPINHNTNTNTNTNTKNIKSIKTQPERIISCYR